MPDKVIIIGSFNIDDGDGNDSATNKQFDWSSEKNKRAARAARTYEQVRAILCKTTTWNYNVYRFDDHVGIQLYTFNSLYLLSRRTHQSCQNYRTRTRWDNHKQTQLGRCLSLLLKLVSINTKKNNKRWKQIQKLQVKQKLSRLWSPFGHSN